jgi:hypothetical protein
VGLGSFDNPITGSGGNLVINQIQSPNFSIAAKTGWQIQKNGDATFYDITAEGTVTATSFQGTDFDINSAGAFFYSGTPGPGNLAISIAPAAGTDPTSGQSYIAGVESFGSTGTAQLSAAALGIYNTSADRVAVLLPAGLFIYSGNGLVLEASAAGSSGTDSQTGLTYPQGFQAQSMNFVNQGSNPSAGPNGPVLYSDNTGTALQVTSATGMVPQLVGGNSSATTFTVTGTSAAAISKTYQIMASDPQIATVYRLKVFGNGTNGSTADSLHIGISVAGADVAECALTSTIIPASGNFGFVAEFNLVFSATGVSGSYNAYNHGQISQFNNTLTSSNSLGWAAQNSGNTVNTGTQINVFAYAFWFTNTGSPTLTSRGSTFERIGA